MNTNQTLQKMMKMSFFLSRQLETCFRIFIHILSNVDIVVVNCAVELHVIIEADAGEYYTLTGTYIVWKSFAWMHGRKSFGGCKSQNSDTMGANYQCFLALDRWMLICDTYLFRNVVDSSEVSVKNSKIISRKSFGFGRIFF